MKILFAANEMTVIISVTVAILALLIILALILISRYKKCPSDKIMVIYGRMSSKKSCVCIHGGAKIIWPFIQSYTFLDLHPISFRLDIKDALTSDGMRMDVPARFTVAVSMVEGIMQNAAERLLGLTTDEIREIAGDIILVQFRLLTAKTEYDDITAACDKFLTELNANVEAEISKIGLRLINCALFV